MLALLADYIHYAIVWTKRNYKLPYIYIYIIKIKKLTNNSSIVSVGKGNKKKTFELIIRNCCVVYYITPEKIIIIRIIVE